MQLTRHARIRRQQRGFSRPALRIIQRYGRCENVPGGALRFFFGEKEYRQAVGELKRRGIEIPGCYRHGTIQLMDRAKNGSIIVKDGRILTAYK
jgi:hypothetical protein